MIQFDEHIFQIGWNHQLDCIYIITYFGEIYNPDIPGITFNYPFQGNQTMQNAW